MAGRVGDGYVAVTTQGGVEAVRRGEDAYQAFVAPREARRGCVFSATETETGHSPNLYVHSRHRNSPHLESAGWRVTDDGWSSVGREHSA
jgi:hypothetical protein